MFQDFQIKSNVCDGKTFFFFNNFSGFCAGFQDFRSLVDIQVLIQEFWLQNLAYRRHSKIFSQDSKILNFGLMFIC